jgi:transcriptional regulator with GAF, ATPase, and Fis domain
MVDPGQFDEGRIRPDESSNQPGVLAGADPVALAVDEERGSIERSPRPRDVRALERNAWNVTQTARYLGVPLSTLKFKMERLEIRELARKIRK